MAFNTNPGRQSFTATASQTDFTFNFKIFVATDINVYQTPAGSTPDDTNDLLTYGSDYTVTIDGDNGGIVTLLTGATLNDTIVLVRDLPLTRAISYVTNGDLIATTLNEDQNYQTYLLIDGFATRERAVVLPLTDISMNRELPNTVFDGYLKAKSDGSGFEYKLFTGSDFEDIVTVDTILDLSSIDTNLFNVAIVKEEYRGGVFIYDSTKIATNNGGTIFDGWVRQYSGDIDLKWFDAKGDGSTDDTTAIQSAINMGGTITGEGTYKATSTLTIGSNTTIKNININSSAAKVFTSAGSEDGYISLASDASYKSFSCVVSDATSFSVDDWCFIKSNGVWSTSDSVTIGEYVKIQSISGTTLYFYDGIVGSYLVSDSASISPVTHKINIEIIGCTINGDTGTNNQIGFEFNLCKDVRIKDCKTNDMDYTHISFIRSVNYDVVGGESSRTGTQEGLDYGVTHTNGCYNGKVSEYTGNAMRHISSIGGSAGISRFINVSDCFGYSLTDAGIDAHSSVYEHTFINNFLSFDDTADTTVDGIISSGGRPVISNNIISNCRRHGVFWQPSMLEVDAPVKCIISNNETTGNKLSGTTACINVVGSTTTGETSIDGINISGNSGTGFDYLASIKSGVGTINNVVINGINSNNSMALRGVVIDASTSDISNVNINGNVIENTTNENIYLIGSASFGVKDINISSNNLKGGTYGIRGTYVVGGKIEGNYITGYSSGKILFDANSNIAIDKGITKTQTGAPTYTLLTHETDFIYNRAETLTLTLPDATVNEDMEFRLKTIQAFAVNSASSNVVPINSTTAGTAILPATAGAWCTIKSNGTNWVIYQQG